MRKSLCFTKHKGEMKVKGNFSYLRCDPIYFGATPSGHNGLPCGCERAYMLGPERW